MSGTWFGCVQTAASCCQAWRAAIVPILQGSLCSLDWGICRLFYQVVPQEPERNSTGWCNLQTVAICCRAWRAAKAPTLRGPLWMVAWGICRAFLKSTVQEPWAELNRMCALQTAASCCQAWRGARAPILRRCLTAAWVPSPPSASTNTASGARILLTRSWNRFSAAPRYCFEHSSWCLHMVGWRPVVDTVQVFTASLYGRSWKERLVDGAQGRPAAVSDSGAG